MSLTLMNHPRCHCSTLDLSSIFEFDDPRQAATYLKEYDLPHQRQARIQTQSWGSQEPGLDCFSTTEVETLEGSVVSDA